MFYNYQGNKENYILSNNKKGEYVQLEDDGNLVICNKKN